MFYFTRGLQLQLNLIANSLSFELMPTNRAAQMTKRMRNRERRDKTRDQRSVNSDSGQSRLMYNNDKPKAEAKRLWCRCWLLANLQRSDRSRRSPEEERTHPGVWGRITSKATQLLTSESVGLTREEFNVKLSQEKKKLIKNVHNS